MKPFHMQITEMSSEIVPALDGGESEMKDSATEQGPSFDDIVNWRANVKVKLIGPNHEMKLLLSPEKGHKYVTHMNPTPASVKTLLEPMKEPSVLLLRGCDKLLLPVSDFPFEKFNTLTTLEISGVTHLTTLPEDFFSQMSQLQSLNLSHLPIQKLPSFRKLKRLLSVVLNGCPNLYSLPEFRSLEELEYMEISHLPIEEFDDIYFFHDNRKLRWVVFRGCSKLRILPCILLRNSNLEVLDLSHCTVLRDWGRNENISNSLKMLDLSYTPLREQDFLFQYLFHCDTLTHLFLRDTNAGYLAHTSNLQVLDLSGSPNVSEINWLQVSRHLVALDLSRTDIESIDFLSILIHLRSLILRECFRLVKLPAMSRYTNLEVLDISSCKCLEDLPEDLSSLRNLKELNLSACSCLQELREGLFDQMSSLEKLDLSKTEFNHFPSFANLSNLKELLLANCQKLKVLPDVRALTNLETLDLSLPDDIPEETESNSVRVQFFSDPSRLQKLVLTNRPAVLKLFPEVLPQNLQYLDLHGARHTSIIVGVHSSENGDVHPSLAQRKISKCDEIHLVATFLSMSSGCDRFRYEFSELEDHILKIQKKFKYASPNEVLKRKFGSIRDDLKYFGKNMVLLESSVNCKIIEDFMHNLLDVATDLSKDESPTDYTKLKELLRIVVKLKLLVPRRQVDDQEEKDQKLSPKSQWDGFELLAFNVLKEEEIQKTYDSLAEIERNCLFYFSVFPRAETNDVKESLKHSRIQKRVLIQWWISEGILDPHHVEKAETVEEFGKRILNELEVKKLIVPLRFQGVNSGSCTMIPTVHSFVTQQAVKAGFFDFHHEYHKLPQHLTGSKRVCLLKSQDNFPSSCRLWASYANSSEKLDRFKTIHTLFNTNETMIDIKAKWFSKMRNLSVLHLGNLGYTDVEHIEVEELVFLEELKNMKHLRLLSLEGFSTLKKLPDSVCELSNLRILNLRDCGYLEELPTGIGSLKNLTHLDVTDSRILSKLPKGISLLSKLEVLKGFVIYYQLGGLQHRKACTLRDLLMLKNLRKLNLVVNSNKFPDSSDLQALKKMKNLCNLKISWEKSYDKDTEHTKEESRPSRWQQLKCWEQPTRQEDIPEELGSNDLGNLRKLVLFCFPFETASTWLDPRKLENLVKLYVIGGDLATVPGETSQHKWNVKVYCFKHLKNLPPWIIQEKLKVIFPNAVRYM